MTFETKSSLDQGSNGSGGGRCGGGGPYPPAPLTPPHAHTHTHTHTHTHKLMCFLYFRHIEAIACKTTNRSIHINSNKEVAMHT